jgi:AcrR family transcriptional regulator
MKNTREKILQTALALFNQHGYTQVTIRMIAGDMGISSGNLNYHFKKREDILVVLYEEMVAVFDQRVSALPDTVLSLERVYNDIKSSMERMVAYRFFWTDLYHILGIHAKIRTHFHATLDARRKGYAFLFKSLEAQSLLLPAPYPGAYKQLAEKMIIFSNTWIYAAQLYPLPTLTTAADQNAKLLFSYLWPYLTPAGKAKMQAILPSYFQ